MISGEEIQISKAIQRSTGSTFHLATRLFPPRVRRRTYVLYAFFRLADEIVDDPDPPPPDRQHERIDWFHRAALGDVDADEPVLAAFSAVRRECAIPDREVTLFLEAMRRDIAADRYHTFEELETYLRGSAVAVAFMMLAIMDPDHPVRARPHARALGEAFQLTNFLRDVREDVESLDRVYLPVATLERYGVDLDEVRSLTHSDRLAAAIGHELRRTEVRYRIGVAGIDLLPRDCRFAVLLAAVLYAEHHRLIRARRFDVVSARPTLTRRRSLWLVAATAAHWAVLEDPEAVFYRVSAVEPAGSSDPKPSATTHRLSRLVTALRNAIDSE